MGAFLKTLRDEPALSGKGDRIGDFYRVYTVDEQGHFILQPKN